MADRPIYEDEIESDNVSFETKLIMQFGVMEFGIDYSGEGNHIRNKENELLQMLEDGWRPFSIYWRGQVKYWCLHRVEDNFLD